jgi:hypothetical protein
MSSIRKRLQKEKLDFQKELASYDKDYIDDEIEKQNKYDFDDLRDDYDDYYDDYYDDHYDDYDNDYDDYVDDYWWNEGYDGELSYKPGNHIKDKKTEEVYIVAEDYRLVNILNGKYKSYLLDYEVVL